jgi:hypothetical protein
LSPLELIALLLAVLGLTLVAGFCFLLYWNHRIPQFLVLGFALVPFGTVALFLRGTENAFCNELGLYAAVVALLLVIGFAIAIFYPEFLQLQWFLPFSVLIHLVASLALIVRHETTYDFSEALFIPPLLCAVGIAIGFVTWKYRKLTQLTSLLAIFLASALMAGFLWFFAPSFGYFIAVYGALAALFVITRANNPKTVALLYREYLRLSASKQSEGLIQEDISIGVLAFGPRGPELLLESGDLFDPDAEEAKIQFTHFYFTIIRPMVQDSQSFLEIFGPLRPFGLPRKQSLVCVTSLSSIKMGDQRLGGKTIAVFTLLYPRRKESTEVVNLLRIYLHQYVQDLESLEEVSQESLQVFRQSISNRLERDLIHYPQKLEE